MNMVSLSSEVTIIAAANPQNHQLMEKPLLIHDIRDNPTDILVPRHFSPTKPDFHVSQLLSIVPRKVTRHTFEYT
jgi:hypothetical protein